MRKIVLEALTNLKSQRIILYPTDTVWGIGCDATNEKTVSKVFNIKNREERKSLVILVDSLEMLKAYVSDIPEKAFAVIENSIKPTTIIYKSPKGLAQNVVAKDNTVAIRLVRNEFCQKLINEFGKPIVSTSANISGKPTPKSFNEIDTSILDAVDYVVNLHQDKIAYAPSTIIKFNDIGDIEVIRE